MTNNNHGGHDNTVKGEKQSDFSHHTWLASLGLLGTWQEYLVTLDNFPIWRRHLAWAKTSGHDLKAHTMQRFSSGMVFLSLLLGSELGVLFNSSTICENVRNALGNLADYHTLRFWIGVVVLVSVGTTVTALMATFTAWGMVSAVHDENVHCILRSSIGQYVTHLPSRLALASLYLFGVWVILFAMELLDGSLLMQLIFLVFLLSLFFQVVIAYSAFGRMVLHTGAMGQKRVLHPDLERALLPSGLYASLLIKATNHKRQTVQRRTSVTTQYRRKESVRAVVQQQQSNKRIITFDPNNESSDDNDDDINDDDEYHHDEQSSSSGERGTFPTHHGIGGVGGRRARRSSNDLSTIHSVDEDDWSRSLSSPREYRHYQHHHHQQQQQQSMPSPPPPPPPPQNHTRNESHDSFYNFDESVLRETARAFGQQQQQQQQSSTSRETSPVPPPPSTTTSWNATPPSATSPGANWATTTPASSLTSTTSPWSDGGGGTDATTRGLISPILTSSGATNNNNNNNKLGGGYGSTSFLVRAPPPPPPPAVVVSAPRGGEQYLDTTSSLSSVSSSSPYHYQQQQPQRQSVSKPSRQRLLSDQTVETGNLDNAAAAVSGRAVAPPPPPPSSTINNRASSPRRTSKTTTTTATATTTKPLGYHPRPSMVSRGVSDGVTFLSPQHRAIMYPGSASNNNNNSRGRRDSSLSDLTDFLENPNLTDSGRARAVARRQSHLLNTMGRRGSSRRLIQLEWDEDAMARNAYDQPMPAQLQFEASFNNNNNNTPNSSANTTTGGTTGITVGQEEEVEYGLGEYQYQQEKWSRQQPQQQYDQQHHHEPHQHQQQQQQQYYQAPHHRHHQQQQAPAPVSPRHHRPHHVSYEDGVMGSGSAPPTSSSSSSLQSQHRSGGGIRVSVLNRSMNTEALHKLTSLRMEDLINEEEEEGEEEDEEEEEEMDDAKKTTKNHDSFIKFLAAPMSSLFQNNNNKSNQKLDDSFVKTEDDTSPMEQQDDEERGSSSNPDEASTVPSKLKDYDDEEVDAGQAKDNENQGLDDEEATATISTKDVKNDTDSRQNSNRSGIGTTNPVEEDPNAKMKSMMMMDVLDQLESGRGSFVRVQVSQEEEDDDDDDDDDEEEEEKAEDNDSSNMEKQNEANADGATDSADLDDTAITPPVLSGSSSTADGHQPVRPDWRSSESGSTWETTSSHLHLKTTSIASLEDGNIETEMILTTDTDEQEGGGDDASDSLYLEPSTEWYGTGDGTGAAIILDSDKDPISPVLGEEFLGDEFLDCQDDDDDDDDDDLAMVNERTSLLGNSSGLMQDRISSDDGGVQLRYTASKDSEEQQQQQPQQRIRAVSQQQEETNRRSSTENEAQQKTIATTNTTTTLWPW